jgi:hypothetical protein
VTSAEPGWHLRRALALGYIEADHAREGTEVDVMLKARATRDSPARSASRRPTIPSANARGASDHRSVSAAGGSGFPAARNRPGSSRPRRRSRRPA